MRPWGIARISFSLASIDTAVGSDSERPPPSSLSQGYSTGWAGFQGVGHGSPTSPKWHASGDFQPDSAARGKAQDTERSFSRVMAISSSIRSGSPRGTSRWWTAVTSLKTRAEWLRE